jgi:hypothetical protein
MRRFICIFTIVFLAGTSLPSAYATPAHISMCKDKRKFTVVNERTFLNMKKNIYKYGGQKYTLTGTVSRFIAEEGFLGYWAGSGSNVLGIGTKGLIAYGGSRGATFASIVEGDFFKANVVIDDEPFLDKPFFLVCSMSRVKLKF